MNLDSNTLHHAHVICGTEDAVDEIAAFLRESFDLPQSGHPDVVYRSFDIFGIDDARWLKEEAGMHPVAGDKRFFILHAKRLTTQAQNALLKTLEEPSESTHIFFVLPRVDGLLPTLRSRVALDTHTSATSVHDIESFLKEGQKQRLEYVKEVYTGEGESTPLSFVQELEMYIHTRMHKDSIQQWHTALSEVVMVEQYINDQSASPRYLLEHLACVLPKL